MCIRDRLYVVFVRLIALLLTVAMWPGLSELVELTVHAAEHGDVAHGDDDEHENAPLGEDEHGCSGTFHLCPCHQPTPAVATTAIAVIQMSAASDMNTHLAPPFQVGLGLSAPPTRPPIV